MILSEMACFRLATKNIDVDISSPHYHLFLRVEYERLLVKCVPNPIIGKWYNTGKLVPTMVSTDFFDNTKPERSESQAEQSRAEIISKAFPITNNNEIFND